MIGDRLAHIRARRSQKEMAESMGISLRTYTYYERNERDPDAKVLAVLVQEGWNANWLLTGEGPERLEDLQAGQVPSQPARLDGAMMGRALASVRRLLAANDFEASDEGEGELAAILYEMYQHGMAWQAAERAVSSLMRTTTSAISREKQGTHEQDR